MHAHFYNMLTVPFLLLNNALLSNRSSILTVSRQHPSLRRLDHRRLRRHRPLRPAPLRQQHQDGRRRGRGQGRQAGVQGQEPGGQGGECRGRISGKGLQLERRNNVRVLPSIVILLAVSLYLH